MRPAHRPLLLALLLAACSTEGKVTQLATSAAPTPQGGPWSIAVRGCNEAAACDDLRAAIVGRLMATGMVERIVPPGSPATALEVDVSRTRTVSGAERVFFGALAGRNEVGATATLRDVRGATLRSYAVESGSAAHPFSGESGRGDAYTRFASDVVAGLR